LVPLSFVDDEGAESTPVALPRTAGTSRQTATRTDDPVPDRCRFDDCSLREAVIGAEGSPGLDYIELVSFGNATSAGQIRWYGSFPSVPNSAPNLEVTYKGKDSSACAQRLQLYDWTLATWKQVDMRNVGSTEVAITAIPPSGDYVSGAGGASELRFRVRCDASGSFFSSGDVMNVKYAAP
jgi:hypothetical protein